jgi:hypothetical protein
VSRIGDAILACVSVWAAVILTAMVGTAFGCGPSYKGATSPAAAAWTPADTVRLMVCGDQPVACMSAIDAAVLSPTCPESDTLLCGSALVIAFHVKRSDE